jgi:hypothetical protein
MRSGQRFSYLALEPEETRTLNVYPGNPARAFRIYL